MKEKRGGQKSHLVLSSQLSAFSPFMASCRLAQLRKGLRAES
jgi:hypothetical protein